MGDDEGLIKDERLGRPSIRKDYTSCGRNRKSKVLLDSLKVENRLGYRKTLDGNVIPYRDIGVFRPHASTAAQNCLALQLLARGQIEARRCGTYVFPFTKNHRGYPRCQRWQDYESNPQAVNSG